MSLTRVGRRVTRIFDQYSVICVFGSVFGCVVVPLLTQSVETLIFSAIVISLTAKRMLTPAAKDPAVQDERRKSREKDERKVKRTKKASTAQQQALQPTQQPLDTEQLRRQREADLKKLEETRRLERERKLEERREKKARKREERNKLKEEESKEKEREEKAVKQIREERALQKQQEKEIKAYLTFPLETIKSAITGEKPLRRERKNSTSSSASSGSAHSSNVTHPQRSSHRGTGRGGGGGGGRKHGSSTSHPRRPTRASSDPQLAGSSPSPPPIPFLNHANTLPSQSRGWQPLPDPQGSPPWCPDLVDQQAPTRQPEASSVAVMTPSRQRKHAGRNHSSRSHPKHNHPQPIAAQVYPTPPPPTPPHYHGNQHLAFSSPPPNWGNGEVADSRRVVVSKLPESHNSTHSKFPESSHSSSVVSPFPAPPLPQQRAWVPGPQSAPANLTSQTIPIGTPSTLSYQPAHSAGFPGTATEAFSGGDLSPVAGGGGGGGAACNGSIGGSYSLFSNEQSPFSAAVFLSGIDAGVRSDAVATTAATAGEQGSDGVSEWPTF